jgi:16S rRNA (guanine527-N7)-methyltransferase
MTELPPNLSASNLPELFEVWQQTLGWQPSAPQQDQFQRLYEQILEGNQRLNLTRITEPLEFWEKHLWDSLVGVGRWLGELSEQSLDPTQSPPELGDLGGGSPESSAPFKVLDIGTGGGFPGVPVAIAFPHWSVTLLDSTRKKLVFLDALIEALGITNARTWVDRAEALNKSVEHRSQYDLVLIRAVGSAVICAGYGLPLLKVGGTAVLYRGQWSEEEAIELEAAAKKLGGEVEAVEAIVTPLSEGVRHCVYLKKAFAMQKNLPQRREI